MKTSVHFYRGRPFEQRDEAKTEIFSYIEGFYNRQRKHSALNYRSPREYELAYANL
ncbi:MAG TPA: IS3 family transposase [Gammaproteobacteria bacterium]|nr:IS3 family transposase [Gammaproteobacteria bacterium]